MIHFNWVNGMIYEFYLNIAVKKTKQINLCIS